MAATADEASSSTPAAATTAAAAAAVNTVVVEVATLALLPSGGGFGAVMMMDEEAGEATAGELSVDRPDAAATAAPAVAILEASNETVQQIIFLQQQQQQQNQQQPGQPSEGGIIEQQQQTMMNTMISAVVNLEVLGELVGATEADLLAGLQHHHASTTVLPEEPTLLVSETAGHPPSVAADSCALEAPAVAAAAAAASDETTPLLSGGGGGGVVKDEEQPPAAAAPTTTTTMEQVTLLSAEPFLECLLLADDTNHLLSAVLPTITTSTSTSGDHNIDDDIHDDDYLDSSIRHSAVWSAFAGGAAAAAISTTTGRRGDEDQQHHQDHHHPHAAFLLNIPTPNHETGDLENHYVLALPEIRYADESVVTETAAASESAVATPFLERALSYLPAAVLPRLPTDIQAVHLEATEHHHHVVVAAAAPNVVDNVNVDDENKTTAAAATPVVVDVHLDIIVDRKVPVIGYVILITGFFALASVGAALDLQRGGVTATMKTIWRQMATSLCLLPMAVKSLYYDGWPKLDQSHVLMLPAVAATYTFMTTSFVLALQLTTLANAFVLSNMASLVIIVGRAVGGLPVSYMEGVGAVAGFCGAAVCAHDAAHSNLSLLSSTTTLDDGTSLSTTGQQYQYENNHTAMWGNVLALSASFAMAGYLIVAKTLRQKMDLFVFMFIVMSLGWIFLLLVLLLLPQQHRQEITFDMHPVHGIFGWLTLTPDRLPLTLYMAVVCNCLGTTGYVAVMKYFSPLVPATVMLLEPLVGALLGTAAGTAPWPGLETWLGDLVVAAGTFLVVRAGARTTESIDATDALRAAATTRPAQPGRRESTTTTSMAPPPIPRSGSIIVRKDTSSSIRSVTSARSRTGQRLRPKVFWPR